MNRFINRFKTEVQENGLGVALSKTYKNANIRLQRRLTLNNRSLQKWADLKNAYEGKRVFLVGNGPSLNETPLYLLQNEYTICFNRFNIMLERLQWKPEFYMCVDPLVANDMAGELNEMAALSKYAFFPDIHTNGTDFRKFVQDRDNILWLFPEFKGFYFNLPKAGLGGTVAYPALQVLVYLGFSEIYLIGVDMNYQIHTTVKDIKGTDVISTKDDDPNHFDPRYFGTNRKYHQPVQSTMVNMISSINFAAEQIRSHSTSKVYNAGINSKLECFDRVNFEQLFSYSEDEKFKIFSTPFKHLLNAESFDTLEQLLPSVSSKEDIKSDMDFFMCDADTGISLFKNLVYNYVYFGPYKNKAVFISRKSLKGNN